MNPDAFLRAFLPMIPRPAESTWIIRGERYVAKFWSTVQWDRTPEADRPGDAQPMGDMGWLYIEPSPN